VDPLRFSAEHPRDYFEQVAELNMTTIHHGVLPSFGKPFLTQLYYELARSPRGGVWGVVENGRVLGFVAGCADVRATYVNVLSRAGIRLTRHAVHAALSARFWRAVAPIVAYPFRASAPVGANASSPAGRAELLAIAVAAGAQGRGIGTTLIRALERELLAWGVNAPYRVATNVQDAASNAFYKTLGFTPCGVMKHHRLTLQVYEKLITENPA